VAPVFSAAFIHERHRFRAAHVAGLDPIELKAGSLDQRFDHAVEMAPAAQVLSDRDQPILPPHAVAELVRFMGTDRL
jgi:hypothetical protein